MAETEETKGGYLYDEDSRTLTINLLGSITGASIEDFESVMANVIDKILSVKRVLSIVLVKEREYEYSGEQVQMLVEIADIVEEIVRTRMISYKNIRPDKWERFYPDFSQRLQYILINLMRRDPIGAYVELVRESRNLMIKMKRKDRGFACYRHYKEEIIEPLKLKMERTKMINAVKEHLSGYHVGDRSLYRELFTPSVRPNFMLTRYMITPPETGKSVDRYKVNDIQVEIYRLPTTSSYYYHVTPPEFELPEDKYTVLDTARRYMATHRPKTAEFVRSEKVREVFYNIGKDMIREVADKSGVYLSTKDLNQLAEILTRYTAGLGVLEVLLGDEKIQDIYINSPIETSPILIFHGDYEECITNLIPTKEDAESWATRLRIQSGRPLDEANPVLDTDIAVPGGKARFAVITKNLSPEGFGFAIRRHRDKPWTLPLLIKSKTLNPLAAGLLSFLIDGSVSILVAGGRGAGKTSLLGSLMLELLPKTRILTIEDSVTGDCELLYEKDGKIEKGKIGDVVDEMIKNYGEKSLGREIAKNPEEIKVFSINKEGKAILSEVSKFIRHRVNKNIYEVETRTGRKIRVTGDHSLFTMGENGYTESVECRKLKKGDHIVTPRILPVITKGKKSINLIDHIDRLEGAFITGPSVSEFVDKNKKLLSEIAKGMGYFIEGPLKGVTQTWKRKSVIPVNVLEKAIKEGCRLKKGDLKIKYRTSSIPLKTGIPLNEEFLTFVGLWIADGCYDRNSVILSVCEEEARNVVRKVGKMFGIKPRTHSDNFSLMLNSKALKQVMKNVFELEGNAFNKRIPGWVHGLSNKQIGHLLNGLFSGDGCVSYKEIMLSLRSENLIKDVQTLLLRFGIIGRCNERDGFYHCRISALSSLKCFKKDISLIQTKKLDRLDALCSKISTHDSSDVIPVPEQVKNKIALGYQHFNGHDYITRENNIGRVQLGKISGLMDYEDVDFFQNMSNMAKSDILWDQVKSVKVVKNDSKYVYDISVPDTENFVCENILAHNTLELPVAQLRDLHYNIASLKSRSVITRVESEMPADEALRTALRLGDSALIIGEVRSTEAKALYEAMRIGALSNVVSGTIHGESAYGVYDRVVNDLGVPSTSFKATDIIPVCKSLRSADGLHRFRRLTEITEIRKHWEENPAKEGGFINLMEYSGKEDTLKPSDTFKNGESEVINRISSYVKEWSGNWESVWNDIMLRAKMKEHIVKVSDKLGNPDIMEANYVVRSNIHHHLLTEKLREEVGAAEPDNVFKEWQKWFENMVKPK
ncbi:MAG: Flp pilus assembly complex ATPase component TadA [Candidatus Aenigmarchaeota archaeon]|nr:Flp pilus assembly complex ATPase component TadA [Candidatus Aenigmarchaeota archaeon]